VGAIGDAVTGASVKGSIVGSFGFDGAGLGARVAVGDCVGFKSLGDGLGLGLSVLDDSSFTGDLVGVSTGDLVGVSTGDLVGVSTGDLVGVSTGDLVGALGISVHSQTPISVGRKLQSAVGITPFAPASCNFPQLTTGCPGNSKIASGSPTSFPSPHTEQGVGVSTGDLVGVSTGDLVGVSTGDLVGALGISVHSQTPISVGRKSHCCFCINPSTPKPCSSPQATSG